MTERNSQFLWSMSDIFSPASAEVMPLVPLIPVFEPVLLCEKVHTADRLLLRDAQCSGGKKVWAVCGWCVGNFAAIDDVGV